ncbi:NAD-dependent epimerase/dehydratase family protein [Zhihengliuella alba]|uniref:NAD-dependent epimerase/dehydratase family protein n=1 Tax=Zhihengliuella alba TaxID=547018 RepID=A0ABP7DW34_9MICC
MESALVIGHGQIGARVAEDLVGQGVATTVMSRSVPAGLVEGARHRVGDAGSEWDVASAIGGVDAVFACFHAAYDARVWERTLPRLERTVLDAAAGAGAVVVFPESTYAFAADAARLHDRAGFAPADHKGRVRQRLLQAREEHAARALSVLAGDLIGPATHAASSVVRLTVTDRVAAGRRPVLLGDPDVPHGFTELADLAAAMVWAGGHADAVLRSGGHRLLIAPSSAPTLREVCQHAQRVVDSGGAGRGARGVQEGRTTRPGSSRPGVVPQWTVAALGTASRTMKEIARLQPLWRRGSSLVASAELEAALGGPTAWQRSVEAMVSSPSRAEALQARGGRA